MPLQIRRGTNAERLLMSQPLAAGELLYVTDDQRLYVGNGATLGGVAVTGYTDEDARDASAALFTNGSHTGITFTYNDVLDTIDAVVDFSTVDTLIADAFQGSLFADDSTLLVDGINGTFNLDGTIKGDIVPNISEAYDIGSSSAKFKDLYLSGNSLFLGDASITASGTVINLPVGSTVGGIEIGLATESIVRDLVGSVIGEDSTILVDATSNSFSTGRIDISENTISSSTDSLVLSGLNIPGDTQTQVAIVTLSAPTQTEQDEDSSTKFSLIRATGDWSMVAITAHKNSVSSPDEIGPGEVLGVLSLGGFQPGADKSFSSRMGVHVDPAGETTSTYLPSKLFWVNQPSTEALASDINNQPIMTFDSFGRLAVNQENAQATVDINGFMKLAVLDTAPASPANGMVAIADGDAVDGWDPLGNGKQSMVVYLSGGWREIAAAP
jgi:hypothetical protein